MPRPQRKPEEIEAVKEQILGQALTLIVQNGFEGLSMRKLASKLGIAAKTIYNYFNNKDELYLVILTRGFENLYDKCRGIVTGPSLPLEKLRAMISAYMEFAFDNVNLYNLMFTWHVPKYNDYVGTPMEASARAELDIALRVVDLFTEAIKNVAGHGVEQTQPDRLRLLLVHAWAQLHGYVAGVNNHLLDYLTPAPEELKGRVLDQIVLNLKREIDTWPPTR